MQQCEFHSNLQDSKILIFTTGGLAQLARASALHAEGQGFDSLILHQKTRVRNERKNDKYDKSRENKKIKKTSTRLKITKTQRSYNLLESE